MDTINTYPKPAPQKGRSTKGCQCAGPCYYCGDALDGVRHDHDHFPLPWRHGGRESVPACKRCHSLKDRGALGSWPPSAIAAANGGGKAVGLVVTLVLRALEHGLFAGWGDREEAAATILENVDACTTPEARICMAVSFNLLLDKYPLSDARED